jgi:hypothetical protein
LTLPRAHIFDQLTVRITDASGATMTVQFDVVYATDDDRELHADIYPPSGSADHHTAVLVYHGGQGQGSRRRVAPRLPANAGTRGRMTWPTA